ncbi:head maturation protease, ClpP-related [Clostridium sp. CF012]|uniref:head maturation protease, ClpP-related n=1 Tax=Clostridium sp. CF012 TaxID=2843319 RepID=UPI001C0C1807|nr:head maturation protease, ClpP-related [Clostridium sp. CF012]MBU3146628.1 Clp protease ClpP [Clostridium sp. CF012]
MKINVKGVIVSSSDAWIYEWLDIEHTSPSGVNKALEEANGEDVEVMYNSGGGDVFAGSEIYTSLKDYKGKSTGKIVGLAASAASVAAMGVEILQISPTAQIMIHNSSMYTSGDNRGLTQDAKILKGIDESIANAYMLKTNLPQDEILKLMENETWLTAQEAKEKGFVNSIMFENENKFAASHGNGLLPQSVIDKIRNEFKEKSKITNEGLENEALQLAKAKLELLTL